MDIKDLLSVAAILISAIAVWLGWANHKRQKAAELREQRKDQPEFEVSLVAHEEYDIAWVVAKNVAQGSAYKVRASFSGDPKHALGLADTAEGPVRQGMTFPIRVNKDIIPRSGFPGLLPNDEDRMLTLTWEDINGKVGSKTYARANVRVSSPVISDNLPTHEDCAYTNGPIIEASRELPYLRRA